jgi:hypothetical protein
LLREDVVTLAPAGVGLLSMNESEWKAVRAIGVRQGTQPRLGKVTARLELSPLPDPEWIAVFNDKSNVAVPWVDGLPPPRVTDGEIAFNGVERDDLSKYIAAIKERIQDTNAVYRDKVLAGRIRTAADKAAQGEHDAELRAEIQKLLDAE